MGTDSAKRKSISIDEAAGLLARNASANERLAAGNDACDCAAQQTEDGKELASLSSPEEDGAEADGVETRTGRNDEEEVGEDGEAEDEESEQAPLEPPKFWDAKAKERFGGLPRDGR